jgi:hypothetical protein
LWDEDITPRKLWGWSRGMKRNMPEPKSFWNKLKNGMKNMPIKHESMWSLKLGNMCG